MWFRSGNAAETKGKSASRTKVVVETRERRDNNREEREEAEGVEAVERRRVGASRIRWIFRAGWVDVRDWRVEVRDTWVEDIEASLRYVVFEGWLGEDCVCGGCWVCCGCDGAGAGGPPREGMGPRDGRGPPRLGNGETGLFLTGSVLCAVGGAIADGAVAVFDVATGNRCVNPSTKTNLSCCARRARSMPCRTHVQYFLSFAILFVCSWGVLQRLF